MFPPSAVSKESSSPFSSPVSVDESPASTYRLKVLSLGAALFALLSAYLATLLVSATASIWFLAQILSGGFTPLQGLGLSLGVGATTLLTFVLVKGLFRRSSVDRSEFIALDEETQPEFFAFLEEIYTRCQAPPPDRVYACPDVNAGVFVETSILDIFRPPRRNLLVGMGMVNALNRTELEAVLAHEFGHFSQRSMRLHDYVRVVTNILEEVIHGRDRIDLAIARWHDDDRLRRGLVAPLAAATALVRRIAGALLAVIRRMEASLSRQMELAADRVAVEFTGSDALIHALKRTDWADRCFSQTLYDLEQALGDEVRTDDLFFHQIHLGEAMRERLDDPSLGIPPELPDDPSIHIPVFGDGDGDDSSLPRADHWDSHPPHRVREEMARQNYRRSTFDDRSAWTLFSDPASLRREITDRVYATRWSTSEQPMPAARVQRHLDGEHAEVILDGDDRIVYGHRFIEPGSLDDALAAAERTQWNDEELTQTLRRLTGADFREALERIERHLGSTASPASSGPATPRPLRSPVTTPAPARRDDPRAEEDHQWLADWDRRLLVATIGAARRQGTEVLVELVERYQFHLHLQDLVRWLRAQTPMLGSIAAAV